MAGICDAICLPMLVLSADKLSLGMEATNDGWPLKLSEAIVDRLSVGRGGNSRLSVGSAGVSAVFFPL